MVYYIEQRHNPDKHELIPNEYPWQVSEVPTGAINEIAISKVDYGILIDNINLSSYINATKEPSLRRQQRLQRQWGTFYAEKAIDLVGEKNLELAHKGIVVNTAVLLQNIGAVKELLMTGALKTARDLCIQIQPAFPVYTDVINTIVTDINAFLYENSF